MQRNQVIVGNVVAAEKNLMRECSRRRCRHGYVEWLDDVATQLH
jgi:hypothetical protein